MQNSELVVGTGSTTCLEALYMGIKMLLIQSWAAKTHSPKLLPTWWLQNAKPDNVLSAIQDSVLIPKETFFSKNKDTIKYYSNYPPKKPAFVVVRDLVLSSLQE
jgi:hypothetical protein